MSSALLPACLQLRSQLHTLGADLLALLACPPFPSCLQSTLEELLVDAPELASPLVGYHGER